MRFLDTPEGELVLFRTLIHTQPFGLSRHFGMLALLQAFQDAGATLEPDEIRQKLQECYDEEVLDSLSTEMVQHEFLDPGLRREPIVAEKGRKQYTQIQEVRNNVLDELLGAVFVRGLARGVGSGAAESPTAHDSESTRKRRKAAETKTIIEDSESDLSDLESSAEDDQEDGSVDADEDESQDVEEDLAPRTRSQKKAPPKPKKPLKKEPARRNRPSSVTQTPPPDSGTKRTRASAVSSSLAPDVSSADEGSARKKRKR